MITIRAEQLERVQVLLKGIPNGVSKAVVGAINKAARAAKNEAIKKVRERYYVKAKAVSETIEIKRATMENQMAIVLSTGSPLALTKFRVTPSKPPKKRRKSPIIVRVVRGEGGPVKGAFVAQMRSGHIGVFRRTGPKRLPIVQLYGPSVPQMLGHPSVTEFVEERARELLEEKLEDEITRMLGRVGK